LRILYVCNEYPPSIHGGIGSFTRDIAEGMVAAGNQVDVWGCYDNIDNDIFENINGVNIYRIKYKSTFSRINQIYFIVYLNFRLRKFLKENNSFDIIESQEWQGLFPFGLNHPAFIIRLHGASVFFDNLLNRKGSRLTHFFEKLTILKAKHLIAVSEFCGKKTLDILRIKKPFKVIHNCVNSQKFTSFSDADVVPGRIVFANSLLPKKGVFELAEAFNLIADKYSKAEIFFIGKTTYEKDGKNIRDLIFERVNPEYSDRLNILGWLANSNDVYNYLASSQVCVYPSHLEGFGIAPLESMILAKPTVFMQSGPGPEVIEDGVSGILVDSQSPESIFKAVDKVFSDSEYAYSLGIEANKRAMCLFDLFSVFIPYNIKYYNFIISK
jgi:glycosyltransferase involved in cell wall biosynthesis